jgi:hypothetical protein
MLFGQWRLKGDRLSEAIEKWEEAGINKREIANRLIKYQTEALQWEAEYQQLCIEARRTFRREGLIPTTSDAWKALLMHLEPVTYFAKHIEPTWPDRSARRAMAYMAVGMQILEETENVLKP